MPQRRVHAAARAAVFLLLCGIVSSQGSEGPSSRASTPPHATPSAATFRLPADIVYDSSVGVEGAVVFRHGTHLAFGGTQCTPCHPAPFSILKPSGRVTHEEMNAGRSCGVCHDGAHAHAVTAEAACTACHPGWGARPPGTNREIRLDTGGSPGPVRFRHDSHAQDCAACHPVPFALKARGTPLDAPVRDTHDACGTCHDGLGSFAVEDAMACDRCHVDSGDRS